MTSLIRIHLFGGLQIDLFNPPISITNFRSRNIAALMGYMALYAGPMHPRDELADLLWPDAGMDAARNNLRVALSSLRRQVELPGLLPAGAVIAAKGRTHIGLNPEVIQTDVADFDTLIRHSHQEEPSGEQQIFLLEKAVQLYRGPLLPGFYDDWAVLRRRQLAQSFQSALSRLALFYEGMNEIEKAREYAQCAEMVDVSGEFSHYPVINLPVPIARSCDVFALPHGEPGRFITLIDRSSLARPADLPKNGHNPIQSPKTPVFLTRFFGREAEIGVLQNLFGKPPCFDGGASFPDRLVTVTGPGGAGKTRLAVEVAVRLSGSHFERVAFVPLADLSEAALILPAILEALGIPAATDLLPLIQITQVLTEWPPTLLVLDNFEHLTETGAPLVADLLRRVPHLFVLLTSRRLLSIEGEREFALPPLPTPDKSESVAHLLECPSVKLFLDRAQSIRPDFQVTARNADELSALCARLEGLPLALELAAAWAQTLTPAQMLARLDHRFDLLQSRRRDVSSRHQTMRATIDVSFRLLPPDLASVWLGLSVFRGGWTLDAAQALFPNIDVLSAMAALREYSLLLTEERHEGMRFRMLETLREYAAEHLSDHEAQDEAHRHAQYFTELAERAEPEMSGPSMAMWLERLEADVDNLRAALTWSLASKAEPEMGLRLATALWPFWEARGVQVLIGEGTDWLQAHRAACFSASTNLSARAALAAARLKQHNPAASMKVQAQAHSCESLRLFREAGDSAGMGRALAQEATALLSLGNLETNTALLDEAAALFHSSVDEAGHAQVLHLKASLIMRTGDLAAAQSLVRQSLALYRDLGDECNVIAMLCHLGCWLSWSRDLGDAACALEEAVTLSRTGVSQRHLSHALWGLGVVVKMQGAVDIGELLFRESLQIAQDLGQEQYLTCWELANILCERGDWIQAKPFLQKNLRLRDPWNTERWYVSRLARVAWAEGQWVRAARLSGIAWSFPGGEAPFLLGAATPADDPLLRDLRLHLRPEAMEAAWKAGYALGFDEALAEATS